MRAYLVSSVYMRTYACGELKAWDGKAKEKTTRLTHDQHRHAKRNHRETTSGSCEALELFTLALTETRNSRTGAIYIYIYMKIFRKR
jgi:hypothetical protein